MSDYWNEKENEKYQKMKVGMDYNDLDFSKVKKFSTIFEKITKTLAIIASIIGILTITFIWIVAISMWKNIGKQVDPNVIENIEFLYGEKFEIVSEQQQDRLTIYKLSPKSNKKIQFTAYKEGSSTYDDYMSQTYKYFVENILDEDIRNKLIIDSRSDTTAEVPFLIYRATLEPQNFEQIEEYTELMLEIRKIGEKQKKRVYSYVTTCSMIKIGKYHSNIQYSNNYSLADFKKQEKYRYINYLKENNLSTESVPKTELENYKPLYLSEVVNEKNLEEELGNTLESLYNAEYNEIVEDYKVNLINVLNYVEGVNLKKSIGGDINSFEYNGEKYKIDYTINEVKGNTFPLQCRISYLEQYFDADVEYDYENKKIYINIK